MTRATHPAPTTQEHPPMHTPRLSPPALDALRNATVTEDTVTIQPVGRNTWQQVNAALVLVGGGGNWDRDRRAWVFPRDPRQALGTFLATQAVRNPADDLAPAGPLLELADRLDALADTAVPRLSDEARVERSGCYRNAATAVRATVADNALTPSAYVVASYEPEGLTDNWDGQIHPTEHAGRESLGRARAEAHHGFGLYALVEVPDA